MNSTTVVIIFISDNKNSGEVERLCELIVNQVLLVRQNFFVTRDTKKVAVAKNNPEIHIERIFVLGNALLDQPFVDSLLDDKWRTDPMSVVAVTESGAGACNLRDKQIAILAPGFDRGILTNGIRLALSNLLPRACNA